MVGVAFSIFKFPVIVPPFKLKALICDEVNPWGLLLLLMWEVKLVYNGLVFSLIVFNITASISGELPDI